MPEGDLESFLRVRIDQKPEIVPDFFSDSGSAINWPLTHVVRQRIQPVPFGRQDETPTPIWKAIGCELQRRRRNPNEVNLISTLALV